MPEPDSKLPAWMGCVAVWTGDRGVTARGVGIRAYVCAGLVVTKRKRPWGFVLLCQLNRQAETGAQGGGEGRGQAGSSRAGRRYQLGMAPRRGTWIDGSAVQRGMPPPTPTANAHRRRPLSRRSAR
mgnify:FL=1